MAVSRTGGALVPGGERRRRPVPCRAGAGGQGLERLLRLADRAGVLVGAQARRRMTGVDDHSLTPAGTLPPQCGGGQPGEHPRSRRPGGEKVRRRQDRLRPRHLEVCRRGHPARFLAEQPAEGKILGLSLG